MKFKVFFRTSKNLGKNPIPGLDAKLTIKSLLQSFSKEEIVIVCDNTTKSQYSYFASEFPVVYRTQKGNSGAFRLCVELAKIHKSEVYYFVEDDHLHLPNQKEWILEGLKLFDFVSLYDHPDKYFYEIYKDLKRKIYLTNVGYFTSTPSTVMTFACSVKTLRKANKILLDKSLTGEELNAPLDHYLFTELKANGFSLGTPIPGRSTHCEKNELSPLINWYEYVKQLQI
tara:strand:+ start:369 stop:1052 length:684 start_codon:yes stop_codon:yes gene_type:complete